jgi:hypothetical protein
MSQPPSFNPYVSPAEAYNPLAATPAPSSKPGYLTFLCVLSLILGCLGAGRGGCVAVTSLVGGGPPARNNNVAQMPPALRASFEKMEAEGHEIDARYSAINKLMILLQAAIGLVMIVGAVMVLQFKRPGDWVLRGAFAATLLVGLVSMAPFVSQMLEMQPLLAEVSENSKNLSGADATGASLAIGVMRGVMYGGICMGAVWLALKAAVFGHGIYYLGKPNVQACLR